LPVHPGCEIWLALSVMRVSVPNDGVNLSE
jgi:hypothetical protein